MDIAIMIEGQNGLNWARWQQIGRLAEGGLQRVMLQWLALDDLDRLAGLAEAVVGFDRR